jgi:tape measure domain-containing protein
MELYGFAVNAEGNAVKNVTAIIDKLQELNQRTSATSDVFKGFGAVEALKKVISVAQEAASYIYNVGKNFEQTALSFEVMTGSAESGKKLTKELKNLADVTPMVDSSVYEGGKMLLNYGVKVNEVSKWLSKLGDISGGNTDRFQRLTYVFGQISAQGRLTGQDLRQMIDAGFNPLQIMSEKTGKSYTYLRTQLEKGNISYKDVTAAINAATSAGGRFFGMMQRQSQTVGGLESTFQGSIESLSIAAFERATPVLKAFFTDATNVTNAFRDLIQVKESEKLADNNAEMGVYFELLKNQNITLDQKKEIINKLNIEYKDYLSSQLTDKMDLNELNKIQTDSNKLLSEKIDLMIRSEKIADALKAKQEAEKEVMDIASINERAKTGEFKFADYWRYVKQGLFGGLQGQNMLSKASSMLRGDEEKNAMATYIEAQKNYNDLLAGNANMSDKIKAAKEQWKSDTTLNPSVLSTNAGIESQLKAGGGLGEAKTINMNFNQPIMQINAQSVDTTDMDEYSERTVDFLTTTIKNMSYPHGGM